MNIIHKPVLLKEVIDGLSIKHDGIYLDGTFGYGGHSINILKKLSNFGKLFVIDKDINSIKFARTNFLNDKRVFIHHGSFSDIYQFAKKNNICGKIDGILLDLGISSAQLNDPSRGFSFLKSGPLDMRMNLQQDFTAKKFIYETDVNKMALVFKKYGEERYSLKIAQEIHKERIKFNINNTIDLVKIIKKIIPKWKNHKHPATRVFQAIRIYINKELDNLFFALQATLKVLSIKGRLVVISFHSLEDRMVKKFMLNRDFNIFCLPNMPIYTIKNSVKFKQIGKFIRPSDEEIRDNIRSRSAILRVGEKIDNS
ncbi:16S rRNA (cytosine(1402)-N(4))-methyltransferase [Candidatus Legionella polyplacis]|uniref:16S rRNA (cytosine(1402)-N(4))-methyltransferase RsmH n=1 Tax=Candidatus Legionella polyplacis TaxID=2005262 RepID=UPI000C1F13F5|nr:16S rRNA (cytosine(1402)-N(4))-methyltransferase RsmH [Candidatus Legionella polyplacis]ATW01697.1 16S rRNA (cytosine(1402)-N(4))-methyltransferase [Candidatus Legionella polyplacis]